MRSVLTVLLVLASVLLGQAALDFFSKVGLSITAHPSSPYLSDSENALVYGMVFGGKGVLDPNLKSLLTDAGLIHVAVASGYNVLLFFGLFRRLLWWGGKSARVLGSLGFTFSFCVITGLGPPVLRAFVMLSLSQLAFLFGRRVSTLRILLLSLLLMLFVDYKFMTNISFQLSFASTFGVMAFSQPLQSLLSSGDINKPKLSELIIESFSSTIAANIMVLPLVMYYFGRFSASFLVTNSLSLWSVPLISLLSVWIMVLWFLIPLEVVILPFEYARLVLVRFFLTVAEEGVIMFPAYTVGISHFDLSIYYLLVFGFWLSCLKGKNVLSFH